MGFWKREKDDPPPTASAPERPAGERTDEELLDAIAKRLVGMGLAVPAVFFLESTKPLSFVGSQALIFLQPFVEAFLSVRHYQRFAELMEDRGNIEKLIQRLEERDEDRRAEEKEARLRRKESRARAQGREPRFRRRGKDEPS
ncbi:MAG: hypothetical protein V1774_08735 [Candidatus Eisenbacteria bacterium]